MFPFQTSAVDGLDALDGFFILFAQLAVFKSFALIPKKNFIWIGVPLKIFLISFSVHRTPFYARKPALINQPAQIE